MTSRLILLAAIVIAGLASFMLSWLVFGFILLDWNVGNWSAFHRMLVAVASVGGSYYVWWNADEK